MDQVEKKILREGFKKKKNVKFGLLAEIRRGRGLRGSMSPTCYQVFVLLFKNDLIAAKHEKKTLTLSLTGGC